MKYLIVYLISTVKFVFAFPVAASYHFNFLEMFIYTSLGGISGVLFFAFLTGPIVKIWKRLRTRKKSSEDVMAKESLPKRINYKRSRRIIRVKNIYGLVGLVILTPCLLSIPVGTFITVRYFRARTKIILFLSLAVVLYSLLFSILSEYFDIKIFDPIMNGWF